MDRGVPTIFATDSGRPLAERILGEFNILLQERRKAYTVPLHAAPQYLAPQRRRESSRLETRAPKTMCIGKSSIQHFGEGEFRIDLEESVRDRDVFLIQSPYEPPQNDLETQIVQYRLAANVLEGIVFADALKSRGASSVTLVSPYLPFARQDHTRQRESLTAATYAKQLHATGLQSVITIEVHSKQHMMAYDAMSMGFENLRTGNLFISEIANEYGIDLDCDPPMAPANLVIVSPDGGGVQRARYFAKRFGVDVAWGDKRRDYSQNSVVKDVQINGEVKGKDKVVVDDMAASGGSMCTVVKKLYEIDGIPIALVATHPLLTGEAVNLFDKLYEEKKLRKFMTMDTIMRPIDFKDTHPWYHEISCAPMIARTLYQMNMSLPVSDVHED